MVKKNFKKGMGMAMYRFHDKIYDRIEEMRNTTEPEELEEIYNYLVGCDKAEEYFKRNRKHYADRELQYQIKEKFGYRALANLEDMGMLKMMNRLKS